MKRILTGFLILLSSVVPAQPPGNYWSNLPCKINNTEDSTFVFGIYKSFRYNYLTDRNHIQHTIRLYNGETNFTTKYTIADAIEILKDSISFDQKFKSWYNMCLRWNRSADTFAVISFSPVCHAGGSTWWPDPCWHSIFDRRHRFVLSDCSNMLTSPEQLKFKSILATKLVELFASTERSSPSFNVADTLIRILEFRELRNPVTCAEPPLSASLVSLCNFIRSGILSRHIPVYADSIFTNPISDPSNEKYWIFIDSSNFVENPNNPGEIILAPVRHESSVSKFGIVEKWIPFYNKIATSPVQSFMSYRRSVSAYSLTHVQTLWMKPADLEAYLSVRDFNFTPFQEIFRTERFKTMWIKSDWN